MNTLQAELSILWPALIAGVLVVLSHVPLGQQVLARGIVFIDLAIAQVAGVGVIAAHSFGLGATGWITQIAAAAAALAGALLLTWTERKRPEVQEALIGILFVLASTAQILFLANDPHGGEDLKDLLAGQILWVSPARLPWDALMYAAILALWFGPVHRVGRIGFYALFACAVTISVQLVGLYLVFATLVIPALATFYSRHRRLLKAYSLGAAAYLAGLLLSTAADLPSGAMVVCTMAAFGLVFLLLTSRRESRI